jgi:DNA-binding transcriptional ArsR family regulator
MMSDERLIGLLTQALEVHASKTADAGLTEEERDFVRMLVSRERIKAQRWEDLRRQLCGWGAISLAGTIGYWVQGYITAFMHAVAHSLGIRI